MKTVSETREVILCHLANSRYVTEEATMDDCGKLADSILSALKEAGYAVVPVEPTKEMIDVGEDRFADFRDSGTDSFGNNYETVFSGYMKACYQAMLEAASQDQGRG